MFAPYHYLTSEIHQAAQCFGLWANGHLASFVATIHLVSSMCRDIKRGHRAVTLPDWQGLGLNMVLGDTLGAAYKAVGKRMRVYPAHPSFVRTFQRSSVWRQTHIAGTYDHAQPRRVLASGEVIRANGQRPNATFEFCGPAMPLKEAQALLATG